MKQSDKLLITYGWNRLAYIIKKSLNNKGVSTYIGDASRVHMNSFCNKDKTFQYPSFYQSPVEFKDYLINYMKHQGIDKLITCHEETFIASKYLSDFKGEGIKLLVPEFESLKLAHKKNKSSLLAKELGISVPETLQPQTEEEADYFFNQFQKPVVLKYFDTNSSKGVFYLHNENDLAVHKPNIGEFILQEYVSGEGYGVSVLYNKGEMKARFTHKRLQEKLLSGGTSTLRMSTRNEKLEEYATLLMNRLNWNGVAMIEFKYNEKLKKGWFIEINPRYWGSLALPYYSGMDFPYLHYLILKEGDVRPQFDYRQGVKVKWLLGSMIGFATDLIKFKKLRMSHLTDRCDHYDDFSIKDPVPFIGECSYYGMKLLTGLNLNPTEEALLKIDEI